MLVDKLSYVGATVSNNRLILQLIVSLNENYGSVSTVDHIILPLVMATIPEMWPKLVEIEVEVATTTTTTTTESNMMDHHNNDRGSIKNPSGYHIHNGSFGKNNHGPLLHALTPHLHGLRLVMHVSP